MENKTSKSYKVAKVIRIVTIAPVMSFIMMTLFFFIVPEKIGGLAPYLVSILFLTIFPVLAYPLQPLIPYYKNKGRAGQRSFAIVMSLIGYIFGIIFELIFHQTRFLMVIYLTYLISAIAIALFSKYTKIKASGHACGLFGPLTVLFYVFGVNALWGLVLVPLLYWSSLKTKRHKIWELVIGSAIPIVIFYLLTLIFL